MVNSKSLKSRDVITFALWHVHVNNFIRLIYRTAQPTSPRGTGVVRIQGDIQTKWARSNINNSLVTIHKSIIKVPLLAVGNRWKRLDGGDIWRAYCWGQKCHSGDTMSLTIHLYPAHLFLSIYLSTSLPDKTNRWNRRSRTFRLWATPWHFHQAFNWILITEQSLRPPRSRHIKKKYVNK